MSWLKTFCPVLLVLILNTSFSLAAEKTDPQEIQKTIKLLDSDDPTVAGKAAEKLGNIKDPGDAVILALVKHLSDKREVRENGHPIPGPITLVSECASDALVKIGTKSVVPPLCKFLADAKDTAAKRRAIQTLSRLGPAARESVDHLLPLLKDKDATVRVQTISAIATLSDDAARKVKLFTPLLQDKSSSVQGTAIEALGMLGPKAADAVPYILPLLDSKATRPFAISIDMIGLRSLCEDAAFALAEIGSPAKAALPKLEEILRQKSDFPCTNKPLVAAYAHCQISGKRKPGLDALLKALDDEEYPPNALDLLGRITHKHLMGPVPERVKKFLKDPDELTRISAIEVLEKAAPPDMIPTLLPLLKDPEEFVRGEVIRALSEHAVAHPELLDVFIDYLNGKYAKESDLNVGTERNLAIEAIGDIGAKAEKAIPLLEEIEKKADYEPERKDAREALKKIREALKKKP